MSQFVEELNVIRRANFKNKGRNTETMRKQRSTALVELRKASRDSQILKRRNISIEEPSELGAELLNPASLKTSTIPEIIEGLSSSNEAVLFNAVQSARKILSLDNNPPIKIMIEAGIVPHCVEFLSSRYSSSLQFEACWILTNIASGTSAETKVIIDAGAIPRLIELLNSPKTHIAEQAAWTLGNIAGDGPEGRDEVIAAGVFPAILNLAESKIGVPSLRNVIWTISNLCRNKNPPPPFNSVKVCLPTLQRMLYFNDNSVLADTCWALSYLTDGSNEQIQAVIDANVVPPLVELLSSKTPSLLSPALRAVGNIVTGNGEQTDSVIQAGALPKLKELLGNTKMNIVKEAAWSISNIAAGTTSQIQALIDADILPALVKILESSDFKSQKEAAWAITNFISGATIPQLSELLKCGVLQPFCNMLNSEDNKILLIVLDGIQNVLSSADSIGELDRVAIMIEECGGLDKLEALQNHNVDHIYEKALNIIDAYFSNETPDDKVAADEVNGQFEFKTQEPSGKFTF